MDQIKNMLNRLYYYRDLIIEADSILVFCSVKIEFERYCLGEPLLNIELDQSRELFLNELDNLVEYAERYLEDQEKTFWLNFLHYCNTGK